MDIKTTLGNDKSMESPNCQRSMTQHPSCICWNQTISAVARQIRQSFDLNTILQTTAHEVQEMLECDRVLLYQFKPDWSGRVVVESVTSPQWSLLHRVVRDPCFKEHWVKNDREGRFAAIADVENADLDPCYRAFLKNFKIRATLAVPLLHQEQLWGLLVAHHCVEKCDWSEAEIEALQQIAVQVGIAINQASLVQELAAAKAELETQVQSQTAALEETNQRLVQEVQERHKIEIQLHQSQDQLFQLAALVESSQDAIVSKTCDGIITRWNNAAERLFGYSASEIIGSPVSVLIPLERQEEAQEILQRVSQGERVATYETQRQRKDKTLIDVALTISPICNENNQVIGISKIARDISDRKKSEKIQQEQANILSIFYESSPLLMGVVEISEDDILHVSHNRSTVDFFGTTAEAMTGKWASELGVPVEHRQLWLTHYHRSQELQQPVQFEYKHQTETATFSLLATVSFIGIAASQREKFSFIVQDISDRKLAQANQLKAEKISQELKLLENILDIILAGYWDWDMVNNREYLSPGFKQMFGYENSELSNCPESWQNWIFPEDFVKVQAGVERHIRHRGKIPLYEELRYRHKDGSTVWVMCSGQVIEWDDAGNPLRMIGCHIDISDRVAVESELKAAKDQLELVLKASSEGFWDWDLITNEIYFSPRWKEMLGYQDEELENSFEMWESLIFKEDRIQALKLIEDYNQGHIDEFNMTQRFHHKNGSTVYILSRAIHLNNEQGQAMRMVGSYLDITQMVAIQEALKTSEMQLSGVLNSSLDGIMAFQSIRNEAGKIVNFRWLLSNPTACELVGRSATELIGKNLLEVLPGNREEGLFDVYCQVVNTGEPIQQEFYYNYDGVDCWFENIAVKLGDGFAVTFRNITNLKQSKAQLQQVNQELENSVADLKQRHTEMLLLSEASDFLQACLTVEEACEAIASLIEPLFPDCSGGLFITSPSRDRLENVSSWGQHLHSLKSFQPHDCWGLRRGRTHLINSSRSGLRCRHIQATANLDTILCIPMIAQGETLGLFYLSADRPDALPEAKQHLARTVAEQVALAIANLYLRETLQYQSIRDPLTGLFNRRYLEESFNQEIERAQRHHHEIGVIMIDIDHFKRFNDTYGHEAGDRVLQTVGKLLKESIRNSDIACRYGGEEMTLVLPESSLENTSQRADIIREAIMNLAVTYNGEPIETITASFGVASFPQHGMTITALLHLADTALYRSKTNGRNQVTVA